MKKIVWIILTALLISTNLSSEVYGLWGGSLTIESKITVIELAWMEINIEEEIPDQFRSSSPESVLPGENLIQSEDYTRNMSNPLMENEHANPAILEEKPFVQTEETIIDYVELPLINNSAIEEDAPENLESPLQSIEIGEEMIGLPEEEKILP